jgi:SAM-dependent methyltransferase
MYSVLGVKDYSDKIDICGFRVSTLSRIPFEYNKNSALFDIDLLAQLLSLSAKADVAPKFAVRLNQINCAKPAFLAWHAFKSAIKLRLFRMGLFYDIFLDFNLFDTEHYFFKKAPNTLHQYVLNRQYSSVSYVLDFGAASGAFADELARKVDRVVAVDRVKPVCCNNVTTLGFDLNNDFDQLFNDEKFDAVIALDVIEHLEDPEASMVKMSRIVKNGGLLLASTGNISFFVTRLMLLLGLFNYGKRGILDMTHKRLFTISSFVKLLKTYGFYPLEIRGFGPPIRDLISQKWPFSMMDSILSRLAQICPAIFAYNFLIVARRNPVFADIFKDVRITRLGSREI